MCTITKKDLIDRVCSNTGRKRQEVKEVVQSLLDEIIEQLGRGHRLEFRDFGVFEPRLRKRRTAQNPRTLTPVTVPPRRTVKFKVGRLMRDRLDRPEAESAATETPVVLEPVVMNHTEKAVSSKGRTPKRAAE